MPRIKALASSLLPLFAAGIISAANPASILIEGEAFQFKGKWIVEKSSECLGSAMLRVYQDERSGGANDALTVINIPQSATYHVWTRSQDYANSPRPRTYTLTIDDHTMAPSGAHGVAGFRWEHVGSIALNAKPSLLRLSDTGKYYGRCDAILLTADATVDPNSMTNSELARWRRNPQQLNYSTDNAPALTPAIDITSGYTVLASAANDSIRISFVRTSSDGPIVCKTDFYADGLWRRFGSSAEDNRVALVSTTADSPVSLNFNNYYPSWHPCAATRTLSFNGREYPVIADGDNSNPYFAGALTEPRVTAVSKTSADCIKVTYDCGNLGSLTGFWTVPRHGSHISVRFRFKPVADGTYSIVLHGAKGIKADDAAGALMPPMFAGKRLPETPLMLASSMMSQCLSAVTAETAFGEATSFICADLDAFPADWGGYDHSPMGFTLRNSLNELQPVGFAPLPGMTDANIKANKTLEVNFITGIMEGNWAETLGRVSSEIFGVSDYRRPNTCSLTKQIENVATLIKDNEYSGWNPALKGFWDIEADGNTAPTVVQASPLALIGAATMMHDEELYLSRALPTIEFLLSRNGYRFRANQPAPLNPLQSQFPTTLFEGINSLTGELNPWLKELALPNGKTRSANGYFSSLQEFRQEISAMRLTGNATRLQRAIELADRFAAEILDGNLPEMSAGSFYNSQMIPDWTPLLDLYDLTGNDLYLQAAERGAALTMAGVKTWPKTTSDMMTVNPGNKFDGVTTIWWKGTERFRLGFPRTEGDAPEHQVETSLVSPVGLGMEQPATCFVRTPGKTVRPVFMNSWAPRLMELGAASGKPVFNIYGRNALIGRAANYPGYYATGFTDLTMAEDFPYKGPDVSSIYYHHIPAYLAMLQDALLTEITSRSNGAIEFDKSRQEGFVWFANNVYGNTRGHIDGEAVTLYMPLGAVNTNNPAINALTARSDSQLHVILTNDGSTDETATLTFSADIARRLTTAASETSVTIAPRAVKVLSFDADFSDLPSPAPLTDGMAVIETSTPAGSVYLYRIRSPFGHDSVYGFTDCSRVEGLTVTAECNGQSMTSTTWPYEWSFGSLGYDEPADISVSILINGKPECTVSKLFNPVKSSIHHVRDDEPGPTADAIFTLDGRRIISPSKPGIYIVNGKKILKK